MGLDITISRCRKMYCPHCGKEIGREIVESEHSGGRAWYSFLEKVGYYVPYDKRTEENDWYGKDMTLTEEQTKKLYNFAIKSGNYCKEVQGVVAKAVVERDDIVINADW